MKQKTSRTLYAYWNAVRADRIAPRRFEIEPSQISAILPNTFILEKIGDAAFRYRLAGTAICEAFGQEFRDTDFLAGWDEEDELSIARLLTVVTQQGGVGLLEIEAQSASGQVGAFEVILLPFVHTRDSIDRIMGAVSPFETPEWLGHEVLTERRLLCSKIVWPNGRPQSMLDAAHRQAPFLPHIRRARIVRSERRQFRVYDGGLSEKIRD